MLLPLHLFVNAQSDTLDLHKNNNDSVNLGVLNILTEPENGAAVYIDGILAGYTPFLKNVAVGHHKLCVKKEQYYDYTEDIVVRDNKMVKKIKMNLMYGYVQISSSPIGAVVYINNEQTNLMTPCTTGKIIPGEVFISLKLDDYQTFDTVVNVKENNVHRMHVKMARSGMYDNMSNDEYYNQLYSEKTNITTMPVSDYVYAKLADSVQKKVGYNSSKRILSKERNFWSKKENEPGGGLWLKIGSGFSGVSNVDSQTSTFYLSGPTFHIGAQFTYRFNRFFGLGAELVYSTTMYKVKYNVGSVTYNDKFVFNNIDLPILAKAYFLKNGLGPMIELGTTINYKFNYNRSRDSGNGEAKLEKFSYGAMNIGFVSGVGYDFKIANVVCNANFRAVFELTRLFDNVSQKMLYFQIGLGVKIY